MHQMTIFEILEEEEDVLELCHRCVYNKALCCGYTEPLGNCCEMGDAFIDVLQCKVDDLVEKYKMDLGEMIRIIEQETGLTFKTEGYWGCFVRTTNEEKKCKVDITIDLDRYNMEDCDDWFLSFDFQYKALGCYGGGRGCDSIAEVINDIKTHTGR